MKRGWWIAVLVIAAWLVSTGSAVAQGVVTATVRPNPLDISLTAPATVNVGQWFEIEAEISNHGSEPISKTVVMLNTPNELTVRKKRKRNGILGPRETQVITWQAKGTKAGDELVIQVEVEGILAGEKIVASEATIISAVGSLAFFWRRLFFGA